MLPFCISTGAQVPWYYGTLFSLLLQFSFLALPAPPVHTVVIPH